MHKLFRTASLLGVAMLAVAGTALAASGASKVMTVNLPDGSLAHIEYQGDVAPQVKIDPPKRLMPPALFDPVAFTPFGMDWAFAQMDQQAAAMMRQVDALRLASLTEGGKADLTALGKMPAGTVSYSFVSTSDGRHTCSRSWQLTSQGGATQPKLVSTSSGDCAPDGTVAPAATPHGLTAPNPDQDAASNKPAVTI